MLGEVEVETLRLARFVDNLLHMTRIDAGALKPSIEKVDLSDVVGSALKRLDKILSNHEIKIDIASDAPMVPLDFTLAEHVLVNLLENAAKYAAQGSRIEVAVEVADGRVELTVRDEGPGIPPGDMTRIFERFFRLRIADHRPAGVGLGLAICKGFVEAMGGIISARNRNDKSGAVFTISFPLKRTETSAA